MGKKFNHLTFCDRLKIEIYLKCNKSIKEIAQETGVHISTIYREIKRGRYVHMNTDLTTQERYSPDIAQTKYNRGLANKGANLKIGNDIKLANYIEHKIINDKYSPAAVLGEIKNKKLKFSTSICTATLYSYIEKGIFLNLTNKHLPSKSTKKRIYRKLNIKRVSKGTSIEKRPIEVMKRNTFGHWEMDTVIGKRKKGKVLLVLTERMTRKEIITPMANKKSESVVKALNRIERNYGKTFYKLFKTITVDNGCEFADYEGMEKAKYRSGKRTKIYYCHPYSSFERGSNENQNKLIRRFLPKSCNMNNCTIRHAKKIEQWINAYPRKIFNYHSAEELFEKNIKKIL